MIDKTVDREKEEEANTLALLLLVPSVFLDKDLQALNYWVDEDDVTKLAKKYKVTPLMMAKRLELNKKKNK